MVTITLTGYDAGATLYAFPVTQSLADWTTYRVLLTEGTGANAGRYVGSVDPDNGTQWLVFSGASQPSDWGDALVGVGFELLIAAIKADADLGTASGGMVANAAQVLNVKRSASPVAAGAEVTETRTTVTDTESELVERVQVT